MQHAWYWVTQKLPQIYTANLATFPIRIRKITVQICGNFWVTQYLYSVATRNTLRTSEGKQLCCRSHFKQTPLIDLMAAFPLHVRQLFRSYHLMEVLCTVLYKRTPCSA